MSLQANVLKTNPNKTKAIIKEVTAILLRVDEEIKAAYDRDEVSVSVSLPITFSIAYMSNRNAQRIIYYKILESLIERKYEVVIKMTTDKTIFLIKWLSDDEALEINMQNTTLAKHQAK